MGASETEAMALPVSVNSASSSGGGNVSFYADEVNFLKDEKAREAEKNYQQAVENSMEEDFSDLDELEFWQEQGVDLIGRRIVRIVGKYLPMQAMRLDRLRHYIYRKMHDRVAADEDFVILYIHTNVSGPENSPGVIWLRSVYESLPLVCKEGIKSVYILHPALRMRLTLWGLGSYFSEGLYNKVTFVSRVEFLWEYFRKSQVDIPEFVDEHDKILENRPLIDYGLDIDPAMVSHGMPPGMMGPQAPFHG